MVRTFGDFEFDDRRRCLRCAGQPVRLNGQAVDLLCLLLIALPLLLEHNTPLFHLPRLIGQPLYLTLLRQRLFFILLLRL